MPERRRIRNRADFERTLDEGRRQSFVGFDVVSRPNEGSDGRVGFIVSRRVGNAVVRNRIRRRLRHAIDPNTMKPGNDHIIIAKKKTADLDFGYLQTSLAEALGFTTSRLSPSSRSRE